MYEKAIYKIIARILIGGVGDILLWDLSV